MTGTEWSARPPITTSVSSCTKRLDSSHCLLSTVHSQSLGLDCCQNTIVVVFIVEANVQQWSLIRDFFNAEFVRQVPERIRICKFWLFLTLWGVILSISVKTWCKSDHGWPRYARWKVIIFSITYSLASARQWESIDLHWKMFQLLQKKELFNFERINNAIYLLSGRIYFSE